MNYLLTYLSSFPFSRCKTKVYPDELPNTSVVIVFHNEAWSTLLRTVYSVINRSPHYLLSEVILVDDASERDFLKLTLENYVKNLEVPVKIIRMEERSGLIRARLRGAAASRGQVITFLDAHCECTVGWLEPLLARIKEDRKTVVCPIIDVISDDTFEYMAGSDMTYGGFNWKLNFRWYPVPQREMDRRKGDRTLPVRLQVPIGDLVRRLWVLTHATWIRDPGPGQASAGANPCRLPWSVIHDRGPGQPAAGINPRRLPCSEIDDHGPGQPAVGFNPRCLTWSMIPDRGFESAATGDG
ncbi:hypothetical protein QTO34_003004 [Cnephaeus nilssonii]|uniref:Glycosyltransferase 2-like domain-containing protein n=1 Tax=Cnephaeus nilssonii TaxID=3371016 RepID=A0AA40HT50_CNENI|nr:hypothetical protein QTO34_003004 [Eptesicus nilssonii]